MLSTIILLLRRNSKDTTTSLHGQDEIGEESEELRQLLPEPDVPDAQL